MAFNTNMNPDQMMQSYREQLAHDLSKAEGFRNAYQAQVEALKTRIAAFDRMKEPRK